MNFNHEISDLSRVQLFEVIKELESELTRYKSISNAYQKYFNFFAQINEIIVSKKSEVLDVIKDIQSFNDFNPKKSFVSPKALNENDFKDKYTESNEQNTNESKERVKSPQNTNKSYKRKGRKRRVKRIRSSDEEEEEEECHVINESVSTISPIKFESISDVQEFNQIDSSADPQNDDNSEPKTLGFEYLTNILKLNVCSEETPNQPIVKNEIQTEDNTEEVSNEPQIRVENIRSLRSDPIGSKPEDSSDEKQNESKTQSKRKKRQKTEYKSLKKEFKCDKCDKEFRYLANLETHELTHIKKPKQSIFDWECDWSGCGKRFNTKYNLMRHKQTVHLKERRFECDYYLCEKSFTSKQTLFEHKRSHSVEKPFVCEHKKCGKWFTYKSAHNNHMKKVHLTLN